LRRSPRRPTNDRLIERISLSVAFAIPQRGRPVLFGVGDRSLDLRHFAHRGRPLTEAASEVVKHLRRLWGFGVRLETWDGEARVGGAVECPA